MIFFMIEMLTTSCLRSSSRNQNTNYEFWSIIMINDLKYWLSLPIFCHQPSFHYWSSMTIFYDLTRWSSMIIFYDHQSFMIINLLWSSIFYDHQSFTIINLLWSSIFYDHQSFTIINLLWSHQVFTFELVLGKGKLSQLPRELERRQDWVLNNIQWIKSLLLRCFSFALV